MLCALSLFKVTIPAPPFPLVAGLLVKDDNGERRHLSKIPVEHSRISNDGPLNFTVTGGVTEYFAKK